jgi:hypothetical protein
VSDLSIGLAFDAFAVVATVTPPGGSAIVTRGFWVSPLVENMPVGQDLNRRDPRRVFVLPRADVGALPKGSVVVAVEYGGTVARTWTVDGIDSMEADHVRAVLKPVTS